MPAVWFSWLLIKVSSIPPGRINVKQKRLAAGPTVGNAALDAGTAVVNTGMLEVAAVVVLDVAACVDATIEALVDGPQHGERQFARPIMFNSAWKSSNVDAVVRPEYHSGCVLMPVFIAHVTSAWHCSPLAAVWQSF
mmetsp:Transcript_7757/g.17766  ORF Transcript_7757/g.17766 Transcript_7757/m.17766 type:complete len:137 (+) Transcript_7757:741-1151(+)